MLLIVLFNQRSDLLFLDGFQCCCDIQNLPIWNLVQQRILLCGDLPQDSFHYSIQYSVVIISRGGDS